MLFEYNKRYLFTDSHQLTMLNNSQQLFTGMREHYSIRILRTDDIRHTYYIIYTHRCIGDDVLGHIIIYYIIKYLPATRYPYQTMGVLR